MNEAGKPRKKVVRLGHIAGAHGIQGWVRVYSHTEPREAISQYRPWLLGDDLRPCDPLEVHRHGKAVIARLDGVEDRAQAEGLVGLHIGIDRDLLPETDEQQFYWADLVGLEVQTADGESLGVIEEMMATGANDVMVVRGERERLIPFLLGRSVIKVDLEASLVTVDWDKTF
jgi:16S rRNA processing protein RimM